MPSWGWPQLTCWVVGLVWCVTVEGGVVSGVWGGTRGMVIFPIWMVGGGMCGERVLTIGTLWLGTCVADGKEGRPNKLGVCKCGSLGLDKLL